MSDYRIERQRILNDLAFAVEEIYTGRDKESRILKGLAVRVSVEIQRIRDEDFEKLFNEFSFIFNGSFIYERNPRKDVLPRGRRIIRFTHIFCNSSAMSHFTAKTVEIATISDLTKKTIMFYA